MLTARELTDIRSEANTWLPSVCVIQTHTRTATSGGSWRNTYTPGATRPCRLAPVGGGETATGGGAGGLVGGRISDQTTHVLTLTADTVVEEADRVQVDAVVYEVTAVRKRPELEATRRVEVREA